MTWNLLVAIRRARLGLTLLAALSITLLWASPAKAGTTITQSTCTVIIAQSGDYTLSTDVTCNDIFQDGIDIIASNVTLHLNGHTISSGGTCATGGGSIGAGIRVGAMGFPPHASRRSAAKPCTYSRPRYDSSLQRELHRWRSILCGGKFLWFVCEIYDHHDDWLRRCVRRPRCLQAFAGHKHVEARQQRSQRNWGCRH